MDKSIEELTAEIEALKKENLERELAIEKKKLLDANKDAEDKKVQELKEEAIKDYLAEQAQESHIDSGDEPSTLQGGQSEFQLFLGEYRKEKGLTGLSYEETVKKVCNKSGGGF